MQPGNLCDVALPCPSYEGLHGTVLCLGCGFFGIGVEHPEWCAWEVLKGQPGIHRQALDVIELGERVAAMRALGSLPVLASAQ